MAFSIIPETCGEGAVILLDPHARDENVKPATTRKATDASFATFVNVVHKLYIK